MGLRANTQLTSSQKLARMRAQTHSTFTASENRKFSDGEIIEFKLANNTTLKRLVVKARGYAKVVYSSGTVVLDQGGILGRILKRIDVVDSGDTFKNIDPLVARMNAILATGFAPLRRYKDTAASAAPATTTMEADMGVGAPFVLPATGNYFQFEEDIPIDFEDPFAYESGRHSSLWSLHGKNNCRVQLHCGKIASILEDGQTNNLVISDVQIEFSLELVEVKHIEENPAAPFFKYKEYCVPLQIPAGANRHPIQVPRGGLIVGLGLLVRNTATTKKLSDTAIKHMTLTANNEKDWLNSDFRGLQTINRDSVGVALRSMSAGRHELQGYAYDNFRISGNLALDENNQAIAVGIDTVNTETLDLVVDARGASDGDAETGTINAMLFLQELRRPTT